MRRIITTILLSLCILCVSAQSLDALWKQVIVAKNSDKPRSALTALRKIEAKAAAEKKYGHLISATFQRLDCLNEISDDSLKVALKGLNEQDSILFRQNETAAWIYRVARYKYENNGFRFYSGDKPAEKLTLSSILEKCSDATKADFTKKDAALSYMPFVVKGQDSRFFNNDILSILAEELNEYAPLPAIYEACNQPVAACLAHSISIQEEDNGFISPKKAEAKVKRIDSLIARYEGLNECGALAYCKAIMQSRGDTPLKERMEWIDEALRRWPSWRDATNLKNMRNELTTPWYSLEIDNDKLFPAHLQKIHFKELRNIKDLTIKVIPLRNCSRAKLHSLNLNSDNFNKCKPYLDLKNVTTTQHHCKEHKDYETFSDSVEIGRLAPGAYAIEILCDGKRLDGNMPLFCISNLKSIVLEQNNKRVRFVVVDAEKGHPVADAKINLTDNKGNVTRTYTTDNKGEHILTNVPSQITYYVSLGADSLQTRTTKYFSGPEKHDDKNVERELELFTDRSIYRPGQKVSVAMLAYDVKGNIETTVVKGLTIDVSLHDTNGREIAKKKVTTDEFGVAATEFVLPKNTLNGTFRIETEYEDTYFRVEDYVRPTFEVTLSEPETAYKAGDTITVKGIAKTYSGMPVANARVVYTAKRAPSFWFLRTNSRTEKLLSDTITTDAEGHFSLRAPIIMPEEAQVLKYFFCDIAVEATVTDIAGESHSASLRIPVGNRSSILTCEIDEKMCMNRNVNVLIRRRNIAGKEIDGNLKIEIDGKSAAEAKANTKFSIPTDITSGKHSLRAICENDTVEASFTMFRLTDERPVCNDPIWSYITATKFKDTPNDSIQLQFGSALKDVHAVYSVFTPNVMIEDGTIALDSTLVNKVFRYSERYGNGIHIAFAWVKDGVAYSRHYEIYRPLPDKNLNLKWNTFRNRLTPGQKEEWQLSITDNVGNPVKANVIATLYDKSLDAIKKHNLVFDDPRYISLKSYDWKVNRAPDVFASGIMNFEYGNVAPFLFSRFDMQTYFVIGQAPIRKQTFNGSVAARDEVMLSAKPMMAKKAMPEAMNLANVSIQKESEEYAGEPAENITIRKDLSETAFFIPRLRTDSKGVATLSFTLPESVTTWRFIGFANDKDLRFGTITDETIAQKTVMIQPRMPRFLRSGDVVYIPASVSLLEQEGAEKQLKNAKARVKMQLLDAETEKTIYEKENALTLNAGETAATSFAFDTKGIDGKMLICRMTVVCDGHSDGEQHYLPVLSSRQEVVNSRALTIRNAGETTIDISELLPATAENAHVTVDYTARPELLLVESLPYLTENVADNAVSLSTAYYANTLASLIAKQNPGVAKAIQEWNKPGNNIESALNKNEDLKLTLLNETPWMADAKDEEERMSRLYRLLDAQLLSYRNTDITQRLSRLQNADGSWSWWKGMSGSRYISMHVMQTLLRLNASAGTQKASSALISRGWNYLDKEIAEDIAAMKKHKEKNYEPVLYSFHVDYLYNIAISHRDLSGKAKANVDYLMRYLVSSTVKEDMDTKAKVAIILASNGKKHDADEFVESIKQHTVYREDMGRYFDSYRAAYSWFDYRIPTQTSVIEALKTVAPHDRQTITEMQRWILQSKRTQAWDTPVNAVNAIYAIMPDTPSAETQNTADEVMIKLDGKAMTSKQNGVSTRYDADIKNAKSQHSMSINANPKAEILDDAAAESWAGVYVKFVQPSAEVNDAANGITVKRELSSSMLSVGDKVTVTITITADRDYDFVTITDSRAACLEPVQQLSGWRNGCYQVMRDSQSQYHFDALSKGTHVIKTEYYVSKAGEYNSGTVTAQCAYSPEFSGRTGVIHLKTK